MFLCLVGRTKSNYLECQCILFGRVWGKWFQIGKVVCLGLIVLGGESFRLVRKWEEDGFLMTIMGNNIFLSI